MSLENQVVMLETLSLLGAEKLQAQELADRIAMQVDPNNRPDLALRLLIRRFLAAPHTPDALAQLATAEAWASAEGETQLATQIQLLWCRHVGLTDRDAVPMSVLNDAVREAQEHGGLEAEWRLALAAVQPNKGLSLREEALKHLTGPSTVHDQVLVHLELSADRMRGSDVTGSLAHIEAAHKIADQYQDPQFLCMSTTRLGLHYIDRGLHTQALPYLERALELARSEDDDLRVVILATLLSTLYLQQDNRSAAAVVADLLLVSGARRANWFAVVDGHIIRSSLSMLEGDTTNAINRLVRAILRLRELVPGAAINLLKGRLAELRHELGSAVFDGHYQEAIAANSAV
jgi:tetratricopeptide (TPR) repeat protein